MKIESGDPVTLHSAQGTLASPPTRAGAVPNWTSGYLDEFELVIKGSTTIAATAMQLFMADAEAQVLADDDIDTVDFANNELDISSHAYFDGDGPVRLTTTDTLPAGLSLDTDYYVIYTNSGTIQLATSLHNALRGTAVAFTDAGTGTHTIVDTADTMRLNWQSVGLLGNAGDGAIALGARSGYRARVKYSPEAVAYAVAGTLDTGNVTVTAYPIRRS